jgi:hypothetical protein
MRLCIQLAVDISFLSCSGSMAAGDDIVNAIKNLMSSRIAAAVGWSSKEPAQSEKLIVDATRGEWWASRCTGG